VRFVGSVSDAAEAAFWIALVLSAVFAGAWTLIDYF
jgi:hypothetical protein